MITIGLIQDCTGTWHEADNLTEGVIVGTTSVGCVDLLLDQVLEIVGPWCIKVFPYEMREAAEDLLPAEIYNRIAQSMEGVAK